MANEKIQLKITLAALKRFEDSPGTILCDTDIIGFQARINKTGISYYLNKKIRGVVVEKKIASYPAISPEEARRIAFKFISSNLEQDYKKERMVRVPTIGDCIELQIRTVKNPKEAESVLRNWSAYRKKRVVDFTRQDALFVKESLRNHPCTANNAMKYLSSGINKMSVEIGVELPNPFRLIKQYRVEPRKRFLAESEAPLLINELYRLTKYAQYEVQAYAILMMAFTGQRTSNVLKMNLSEINNGIWVIPATKVKGSMHEIVVPLNSYAAEIVELRKDRAYDGYLFVKDGKEDPLKSIRKTFYFACRNVGIEDCKPHDLRRTMGSWMLMNGTPIEVVSRTLGHTSIQVTERVYAHLLPGKISDATDSAVAAMFKGKI